MKKWLWFILGIVFVLAFIVGAFLYISLAKPNYTAQELSNFIADKPVVTAQTVIEEKHITYLLNQIGAYNLHNAPLGSSPKIAVIVDDDKFCSEVDKGIISTLGGECEGSDISIATNREEVIGTFQAADGNSYMKNSVSDGKTSIEMIAGYTTLFSKGYLGLYQELTGKSLTGNIVKIFSG